MFLRPPSLRGYFTGNRAKRFRLRRRDAPAGHVVDHRNIRRAEVALEIAALFVKAEGFVEETRRRIKRLLDCLSRQLQMLFEYINDQVNPGDNSSAKLKGLE